MRSPGLPLASAVYRIPFDARQIPTKETVGSKAHNLMRIAACGLPVPPAFVLGTEIAGIICARARRRSPVSPKSSIGSCASSARAPVGGSAMPSGLCWFPFVLALPSRCRA